MNPSEYRKQLTDRIIEQLEAGTAPWIKPWDPAHVPAGAPHNTVSGKEYRGGNKLWLFLPGLPRRAMGYLPAGPGAKLAGQEG